MEKKIRVLQITSGFRKGVSGGIASVVTNYCTAPMFAEDFDIDFLALGYQPFEPYREIIEKRNSKLMSLNIHSDGKKRLIDIYVKLKKFLKENEYDIIHVNSGALTQVIAACLAAKAAKSKVVIAHSHNAIVKTGIKQKILNIFKNMFNFAAVECYSCSELAAQSMFPNNILKNKKWIFIPNAIDVDRFEYNEEIRDKYRNELGLQDSFVLGHIGRFNEQKNHEFLIQIFLDVLKKIPNAKLLLVGMGDLEDKIRDMVKSNNIQDKVVFAGQRKDANYMFLAMDVFVFPSRWEGLPVTVVEAQAAGLQCLISDKITPEVCCSDAVKYISINEGTKIWTDSICSVKNNEAPRKNNVRGTEFDILKSGEMLADLYRGYMKK